MKSVLQCAIMKSFNRSIAFYRVDLTRCPAEFPYTLKRSYGFKVCCGLFLLCLTIPSPSHLFAQDFAQPGLMAVSAKLTRDAGTVGAGSEGAPGAVTNESKLRVGPGDLLAVTVFDAPELTQTVRVNDVGDASFSFIGVLHVADLTTDQAREAIARKLTDGNFLLHPQVYVLIQEYGTQGVSVLGQVQKPGVYPVLGRRTLLDVISEAGGTTSFAGSTVTIKRSADGTILTIPLTRDAEATFTSDVQLMPGDQVIVPRASIIYVIGDVGRPGGFVMQNNGTMTVLQAVALAGGQTRTASMRHARLIRKTALNYADTHISLTKVMNGSQPDVDLLPDDILYIPNSTVKSVVYRGAPAIAQAAGNAAVYAVIP